MQWYGIWEFKLNHWNVSLENPSETSPRVKRCASNSIPALAENLYDLLEIFFYSHGYGLVWDNVVCKSLTRIFQKKNWIMDGLWIPNLTYQELGNHQLAGQFFSAFATRPRQVPASAAPHGLSGGPRLGEKGECQWPLGSFFHGIF